jgi:hypothetical protein
MATIQSMHIRDFSDTRTTLTALKSEHAEFQKKVVFLGREAAWSRRIYDACPTSKNLLSMSIAQAKYRTAIEVSTVMWETMFQATMAYKASKRTKRE